ncbi:MAG: hypothetical protein ACI9MF_000802 [Gammaproteobacteria bacterium]|jgi:hypothetical protein
MVNIKLSNLTLTPFYFTLTPIYFLLDIRNHTTHYYHAEPEYE